MDPLESPVLSLSVARRHPMPEGHKIHQPRHDSRGGVRRTNHDYDEKSVQGDEGHEEVQRWPETN